MKFFTVLAAALLLWSCAAPQPASVLSSPSGYDGPTGQIVGSVGIVLDGKDSSPNYENRLLFRSMDGTVTGEISFNRSILITPDTHYDSATEKGSVFSLELPEGKYEFYDVRFYNTGSLRRVAMRAREEFSAPFAVVADQVSYLGSFVAHGVRSYVIPSHGLLEGAYFTVANRIERDGGLIATVYPDIPVESIQLRLLERTAPPFIIR